MLNGNNSTSHIPASDLLHSQNIPPPVPLTVGHTKLHVYLEEITGVGGLEREKLWVMLINLPKLAMYIFTFRFTV